MNWTRRTCKRCGEDVIAYTSGGFGEMEDYHSSCFTELIEERRYQKELDEVLSKFRCVEDCGCDLNLFGAIGIDYYKNTFKLYDGASNNSMVIGLETAKCLLQELLKNKGGI